MAQNFVFLLIGAVTTGVLTMIGKPIAAICIASKARGIDPEKKLAILTRAFILDPRNCRIACNLAKTHISLAKNRTERIMHLESAEKILTAAQPCNCHWWSINEPIRQSIADLRRNVREKLSRR